MSWEDDEWRSALAVAPQLQQVDTGRIAGGFLIIGDREDARDE